MQEDDKKLAAETAVAEVRDGMIVGLGTGSTAAFAVQALGRRVRDEGLAITGVATSDATERLAASLGIACHDLAKAARVDLTIDGADEIDPRLYAVKGAGGAMLREKIIASAATRMVVIADGSKLVDMIGAAKLPVEFLPSARAFIERELRALGLSPGLRVAADGAPYVTDQGNHILDCPGGLPGDPRDIDRALSVIPGIFGHGLFLTQVDGAFIARDGIVTKMERPAA